MQFKQQRGTKNPNHTYIIEAESVGVICNLATSSSR